MMPWPPMLMAKERIAPTERSMPPVRMTRVMPTETMPTVVIWRVMFSKFFSEKKPPTAMENTAIMTTR